MGKIRLQKELCAGTLVTNTAENHREIKDRPHSELLINASYSPCERRWYTAQLKTSLYTHACIHTCAYLYKHIHLSGSDNRQRGSDTKKHPTGAVDGVLGPATATRNEVCMHFQCDL